ncbi:MAG: TIGR00341 family protein [Rikenellaceae bacterium]
MENNNKFNYKQFFKERFNLDEDKASQGEVIENISKGVEFKGTNLWVLVFATFIASLGLNVNSSAVIIGAMLISPLMGPIMGIGLSLGINNFELMKRSLRNFGFMVLVAILVSMLSFTILPPISYAQTELLARTTPTAYDVLIAFFGGLAGIVAQSRKDRTSTVIPGVAIATALMPPLCTAGYGIAIGNLSYFMGAFYLFFINTVFIAFATYIVVRFLKYDKKEFLDKRREVKVKRYMAVVMIITIVPSIIIGMRIVSRTIFETNADRYVSQVFKFSNTQVIDYSKEFNPGSKKLSQINVMLFGEALSEDVVNNLETQMLRYGLSDTKLIVHQSNLSDAKIDFSSVSANYSALLEEKNRQINSLQNQVDRISRDTLATMDIARELGAIQDNIETVSLSKITEYSVDARRVDTVLVCVVKRVDDNVEVDKAMISKWLRARTKVDNIRIFQSRDGL